jgi:iron complex outermembrane recepter protein
MTPQFKTLMLCLLFIAVINGTSNAQQTHELTGKVVSEATGRPVAKAQVTLEPGSLGTVTNKDGSFVFTSIDEGKYKISVSFIGCKPYSEQLTLSGSYYPALMIKLSQESKTIEGVEIIGLTGQRKPYNSSVINADALEKLPSRDIGDFLRNEPNVSGIRKGATNIDPVIRGMKAGQLNVQANTGHKIEGGCPNRMDPASSHFDPNDITSMEILKGPYALRFGPVFGGVLNISTKKAAPQDDFRIRARAIKGWESNWGGNKEHVSVTGGNRRIYFALSGNNHRYENYKDGNGEEVKSSFRKYNYSAELGIAPLEHHEVRFLFKGSHGRDIHFPALAMDERKDNTRLASAGYHYRNFAKKLQSVDFKIYRSDVYHEMDNKWRPFSDTVVAISTVDALTRGGRADFGVKLRHGTLHTGIDFEHINKDGDRVKNMIMQPGLPKKTEPLWQNATIQNLGFFAEYRLGANNKLQWIFSGRLDRNAATSEPMLFENMMGNPMYYNDTVDSEHFNISLSAGLMYIISNRFSVDFALGRGVRNPDMLERFIILLPVGYDRYDYLGNPQLHPESNHQADLTLHFNDDDAGNFSVNGFFSYITDYMTGVKVPPSEIMPQTAGVLGVKRFVNIDYALLYGFEFIWRTPGSLPWGADLTAAYTAGINTEAIKNIVVDGNVVGSEKVINDPLPEIPPLEANLKFHYNFLDKRLIPSVNIRLVAAQNRISDAYDEETTPGFTVAGLNIFYRHTNQISLAAGISNIFDKAYYEHLNRRVIGSTRSLYEPGRIFYLNVILNL